MENSLTNQLQTIKLSKIIAYLNIKYYKIKCYLYICLYLKSLRYTLIHLS